MKGGNRRGFISQVDQLIAVRHGAEAVSGHDHREPTRETAERIEQFCFSRHVQRACCFGLVMDGRDESVVPLFI